MILLVQMTMLLMMKMMASTMIVLRKWEQRHKVKMILPVMTIPHQMMMSQMVPAGGAEEELEF